MRLHHVAEMMGICEFDLFRQAYSATHSGGPNDEFVGEVFMQYADEGVVPAWVSLFAKNVVERCKVYQPARAA